MTDPLATTGDRPKGDRSTAAGWCDRRHGCVLGQRERAWAVGQRGRGDVVHHDAHRRCGAAARVAARDGVGVEEVTTEGVPLMAPVDESSESPVGSEGETGQEVMVPPLDVGVVVMAVPLVKVNEFGL